MEWLAAAAGVACCREERLLSVPESSELLGEPFPTLTEVPMTDLTV